MVWGYYKSFSSAGLCPNLHYKYNQVAAILSVLLSTSTLLLLFILLVDREEGRQADQSLLHSVSTLTLLYSLLQLVLLLCSLFCILRPSSSGSIFHLSVGVREGSHRSMATYGATSQIPGPVCKDDISVFYQRVLGARSSYSKAWEPLSLPISGWLLPGQTFCLLLSFLLFLLHLCLVLRSYVYSSTAVVAGIVLIQQSILMLLNIVTMTDTGFCCPGLSVTQWFLHTDFYTKIVESHICRQFSPTAKQPLVHEWFRSSLVRSQEEPGEELDRAGQLRLLQHLLETTHGTLARQAGLHGAEEAGLFLTQMELDTLNSYYIRETKEEDSEMVLYSVSGGGK